MSDRLLGMVLARASKIYYQPPWAVRTPADKSCIEGTRPSTENTGSHLMTLEGGQCKQAFKFFAKGW